MKKLKMHGPDLSKANIATICELFSGCVTEAADEGGKVRLAVDFDQLRQELSDYLVEGTQERYPVRRTLSFQALLPLEYWIARSSRATTPECDSAFSRLKDSEACWKLAPKPRGAGNA